MTTKEKRYGITLSVEAGRRLADMQRVLELEIGFKPSKSQVVEFLVTDYLAKKPTNSHQTTRTI